MPTYNLQGWVWAGTGSATMLLPVTVTDDDPNLSPYFTNDGTETVTVSGTTYTNPRAGTYELTFTDSGATSHTEDFLLWYTGDNFIFVPLPGSDFDTGSTVSSLGGWQEYSSGFLWGDVTCFADETLILTSQSARPVNMIKVGGQIKTPSRFSPVVWVGQRYINISGAVTKPQTPPRSDHGWGLGQRAAYAGLIGFKTTPDVSMLENRRADVWGTRSPYLGHQANRASRNFLSMKPSRASNTFIYCLITMR